MLSRRRVWLLLCLLVGGCMPRPMVVADPAYRMERGQSWVVVVDVPRGPEMATPSRQVGRLVTIELGTRWFNVLDRDLLVRSAPELGAVLAEAARQIAVGQRVSPEIVDQLARPHGVGQLLVVDVFRHEQLWGRETRITRVGVEGRLVQLASSHTLWQARYDPEISDTPGRGYDGAARRAATELVRLLSDGWPRLKDTAVADWPVVEYLIPN
jgi:hypothetical protein